MQAYILTHEQTATDNLFGMARRYHEYCPEIYKPVTQTASAKELYFSGIDSGYKVGTAGNRATGRSGTVQLFHGSEVAYWPNAEEHFAGVIQSVPRANGTEIILESTGNGIGGMFYSMSQDAIAGNSDYRFVFLPWYLQSEYVADPTGKKFDKNERELARIYGLTDAQLAWRRLKIAELGGESRNQKMLTGFEMFQQEYPLTAEEAFVVSGRTAFDALALKALLKTASSRNR